MEIKNAIIEKVEISINSLDCLNIWLYLNYGNCEQGFGGEYNLFIPAIDRKASLSYLGYFMWKVMKITGVMNWDDVVGSYIRVKCDYNEVYAIGQFLMDDWFEPKIEFALENLKNNEN